MTLPTPFRCTIKTATRLFCLALAYGDTNGCHHYQDWIEALRTSGLTGGYPDDPHPDNPDNRTEMAVFIVNAFGLPCELHVGKNPTSKNNTTELVENSINFEVDETTRFCSALRDR